MFAGILQNPVSLKPVCDMLMHASVQSQPTAPAAEQASTPGSSKPSRGAQCLLQLASSPLKLAVSIYLSVSLFTEDLPSSILLTTAMYFSAPPPRHHRPRARLGSRLGDIPCPPRNAHHGLAHDARRTSALVRLLFPLSWPRTCSPFAIACILQRNINNTFLLSVAGTKASHPSSISPPT